MSDLVMAILTPLCFYGITFTLKDATLLQRPRAWITLRSKFFAELLSCPFCTGFHAGYITYFLIRWSTLGPWYSILSEAALYAFASAAFSFAMDLWTAKLERP